MAPDAAGTQSSEAAKGSESLSPEMVRKVADRVYQLLKEELRIENERFRPAGNHRRFGQGGR
ncbi:MAG: hypothetical protein PVH65_01310 [Chloroflexota bacterium]|jgi:hypothetical protein